MTKPKTSDIAVGRTDQARLANDSGPLPTNIFAELEETLSEVADANPRIEGDSADVGRFSKDLKTLLEISMAINSSLVLDDILEIVMTKAIELMQAERGLIMLVTDSGEFRVRAAYNLDKEKMTEEDYRISNSIARQVKETGKSLYTSDAQADERYANKQSVVELHLRSIMCVPIKVHEKVVGVIYLDNSSQSKMFLKSDLYLFELYAQMVSNAFHNARIYDSLLRMERYNDSVITQSPVGIVVIDYSGQLATINPVALEIFEVNRDNIRLVGEGDRPTSFFELLPEKEVARWRYMINTALANKDEYSNDRYYHNTGYVEKIMSIRITPLPNVTPDQDGLIMTVEDATDKVLMEKYLIMSEKLVAKGEMAASIAHELNNFLAIASNNAELLTLNIEREKFDKAKFNAKTIVDNIFKIKRFVDNLMDFSKPQTEFIVYDIKQLIEDLLFSLRIQPRFKQTHFSINLGHDIPVIEIDVGQIQQVLMNLLNNAADAIEERVVESQSHGKDHKRHIGLNAYLDKDSDRVFVEVTDNGTGMTADVLEKIFSMHFTTKKSGHGLGLSNCKKIMERHHGELVAESVQGEGSTFRLVLPRSQPKE